MEEAAEDAVTLLQREVEAVLKRLATGAVVGHWTPDLKHSVHVVCTAGEYIGDT